MPRKPFTWTLLLAALTLTLAACAAPTRAEIRIQEAWVRPAPIAGGNGAGYLTLTNNTGQDDALTGVRADFASAAEIHQTTMTGEDVMQMQPVERIDLPQGETVTLEPGGYHIMLIGIEDPLLPESTVSLTLTFENAGSYTVPFTVREQ